MNRLTASPLGSYTYGDAAHADAATSIGSGSGGWTASYDEVGNLTCRAAPGSGQTCAGSAPTGAMLAYDNEERLYG